MEVINNLAQFLSKSMHSFLVEHEFIPVCMKSVKVAVHGWSGQCWLFVYKTEGIVGKFDVINHNAI